ncbi:Probable aquaporin SIP2-1 [Striga hermonthica]|uniref:Probable aquaporin SIP2-1 n=1 Tax=Striga hermonthica TaxID=68872 RepID=A0A9N7MY04_STRHE|nr:Probable aquaporin SIP2-1 [Striga hermonthica]
MEADGQRRRLLAADFAMSFMWVWSSVIVKIFVHRILGYTAHDVKGEVVRYAVSLMNMFFFAFVGKATKGGAYNPLTVLSAAVSGDFPNFLFTLGARITAQIVGSIYGLRLILQTVLGIGRGPRLNIDIAKGELTEGFLTFSIVIISLGLSRKVSDSFFMKTRISSLSKLTLHLLGSDLTGGCMNPTSVMGWAFANGEHITKKHLIVYWLAPVEATLASVWVFGILFRPEKDEPSAARKNDSPQLKSEKSD